MLPDCRDPAGATRSRVRGWLEGWRRGDRRQGVWDGSCAETQLQGFDCLRDGKSSSSDSWLWWYRPLKGTAIAPSSRDLVEGKPLRAARASAELGFSRSTCPCGAASDGRARTRDVSSASMQRYALSYAIGHPAAALLARARGGVGRASVVSGWLALCCRNVENRTCPPVAGG